MDFSNGATPKILDTSVIIDGRISDITETGFLKAPWSSAVRLSELQHIADSPDPVKRTRASEGWMFSITSRNRSTRVCRLWTRTILP